MKWNWKDRSIGCTYRQGLKGEIYFRKFSSFLLSCWSGSSTLKDLQKPHKRKLSPVGPAGIWAKTEYSHNSFSIRSSFQQKIWKQQQKKQGMSVIQKKEQIPKVQMSGNWFGIIADVHFQLKHNQSTKLWKTTSSSGGKSKRLCSTLYMGDRKTPGHGHACLSTAFLNKTKLEKLLQKLGGGDGRTDSAQILTCTYSIIYVLFRKEKSYEYRASVEIHQVYQTIYLSNKMNK